MLNDHKRREELDRVAAMLGEVRLLCQFLVQEAPDERRSRAFEKVVHKIDALLVLFDDYRKIS